MSLLLFSTIYFHVFIIHYEGDKNNNPSTEAVVAFTAVVTFIITLVIIMISVVITTIYRKHQLKRIATTKHTKNTNAIESNQFSQIGQDINMDKYPANVVMDRDTIEMKTNPHVAN